MADVKNRAVVSVNSNMSSTHALWPSLQPKEISDVPVWVIGQGVKPLGESYDVTFTKINYDKQVYRPGEVVLTFTVTLKDAQSTSTLSKILKQTYLNKMFYVDVVGFKGPAQISSLTRDVDKVYIAKNYYIHSISVGRNPAKESDPSSCRYMLNCYSLDKKLTLDRYCDVYVGDRFSTKICAGKLDGYFSKFNAELYPGEKKNSLYDCSAGRLMFLGYSKDSNGKILQKRKKQNRQKHEFELKQPYLVQYNESFYDFMSRVLHRCGEFLYFENGKLNIGLPVETMDIIDKGGGVPAYTDQLPICEYQDITRTDESVQTVRTFTKNYIENAGTIFKSEDGSMPYDADMSSDENLYLLKSGDESKDSFGMWIFYTFLDIFFKSDSFMVGAVTAILTTAVNIFTVNVTFKNKLNKRLVDNYVYNPTTGANPVEFTYGVDLADNMCNSFYRQIEKLEDISGRKKVNMLFSSNLPCLYLAQAINLNDGIEDNYVITRMFGEYTGSTSSNSAEAVPIIKCSGTGEFSFLEKDTAVVVPVPGIPHILKSSAMEAVVSANDDPLRVGRVRVRYPWQSNQNLRSPWIRITVPYAGGQDMDSGFLMIPDNEEHVMLDYVGGNIERPYVNGSMYYVGDRPSVGDKNPEHPLYWPSKKIRTIASGNGHNLTFADGNSTNFWEAVFPPLKPMMSLGPGAVKETGAVKSRIGKGPFEIKGGKIVLGDGSAMCSIGIYPSARKVAIDSHFGSVQVDAFTGISLSSPNGDINISAKNINIKAGNNINIQSGTNIDRNPESGSYLGGMLFGTILGTAANMVTKTFAGIDFEKCFDFTFLRCVMDSVLRPVEGTLSLKSNRNTIITAGAGKVTVPTDYLAQTEKGLPEGGEKFSEFMKKQSLANEAERYFTDLYKGLSNLSATVDAYFKEIRDNLSCVIDCANEVVSELSSHSSLLVEAYQNVIKTKFIQAVCDANFNEAQMLDGWIREVEQETYRVLLKSKIDGLVGRFRNALAFLNPNEADKKHNSLKPLVEKIKDSYPVGEQADNAGLGDGSPIPVTRFVADVVNGLSPMTQILDNLDSGVAIVAYSSQLLDSMSDKQRKVKKIILLQALYVAWRKDSSRIKLKKIIHDNTTNADVLADIDPLPNDFAGFLADVSDIIGDNAKWSLFVKGIEEVHPHANKEYPDLINFVKSATAAFSKSFGSIYDYSKGKSAFVSDFQYMANWNGVAGPRAFFGSSGSGSSSLFISNNGGYATRLNKDASGWERVENPSSGAAKTFLLGI